MTGKESVWEKLREELRLLRGRNLLRGREEHFFSQGLISLEIEMRGKGHAPQELHLHFGDSEQDLYAEEYPSGKVYHIREYDHDLRAFMEAIADICRKKRPYLRTNSKQADYRKSEA